VTKTPIKSSYLDRVLLRTPQEESGRVPHPNGPNGHAPAMPPLISQLGETPLEGNSGRTCPRAKAETSCMFRCCATTNISIGSCSDVAASGQVTKAMSLPDAGIGANVECVWPARAILGEGCCWDPRTRKILWVDIKAAQLYALSVRSGRRQIWRLPCRIGSLAVPPTDWHPPADLDGELFLACGDFGLMWLGLRSTDVSTAIIANPEAHVPENRFNDGKMGPDRRYWAGTMHDLETRTSGSLYAFSSDGAVTRLDGGYRVTNGPAFSPDGRTVYHTDSGHQTVYAFDLSPAGQIRNKRTFVQFAPGEGHPDGMTTDTQGNLWIAIWDGSRIEKISPEGERAGHIRMPTSRVTSCTFVGEDETVMYATSASIGVSETDKLAGSLFRLML